MKRLFAMTVVTLLSTAMFFVVVCAAGGPVTIPSKASWTGIIYTLGASSSCPVGSFQAINIGKGFTNFSGQSDWLAEYCVHFESDTSMAGFGWGILTAANGDRLHASLELTVDLSKNPVEWSETEVFVGGTGRFEGVTGTVDSHGTWTSGADPFPFGSSILPLLPQAPQGYVGTSEGEFTF